MIFVDKIFLYHQRQRIQVLSLIRPPRIFIIIICYYVALSYFVESRYKGIFNLGLLNRPIIVENVDSFADFNDL